MTLRRKLLIIKLLRCNSCKTRTITCFVFGNWASRFWDGCAANIPTQLAIVEADCFALVNEQIVSPLGRHWDDRLLRDRNAGQARY